MLNPIEKFKRSILHLNRSLYHWRVIGWWHTRLQCQGGYGWFLIMKWYSSSQVLTAKPVSYPQLTATVTTGHSSPHYWECTHWHSPFCTQTSMINLIVLHLTFLISRQWPLTHAMMGFTWTATQTERVSIQRSGADHSLSVKASNGGGGRVGGREGGRGRSHKQSVSPYRGVERITASV